MGTQRWEQRKRDAEVGVSEGFEWLGSPGRKSRAGRWAVNKDDAGGEGVLDVLESSVESTGCIPLERGFLRTEITPSDLNFGVSSVAGDGLEG